jgi:hypothetical protein
MPLPFLAAIGAAVAAAPVAAVTGISCATAITCVGINAAAQTNMTKMNNDTTQEVTDTRTESTEAVVDMQTKANEENARLNAETTRLRTLAYYEGLKKNGDSNKRTNVDLASLFRPSTAGNPESAGAPEGSPPKLSLAPTANAASAA